MSPSAAFLELACRFAALVMICSDACVSSVTSVSNPRRQRACFGYRRASLAVARTTFRLDEHVAGEPP
jgi:hypothetical protein